MQGFGTLNTIPGTIHLGPLHFNAAHPFIPLIYDLALEYEY